MPSATSDPPNPADAESLSAGGRRRARRGATGLAAAVVVFAGLGIVLFPSAGRDDKYITYWPALTLALDGEILNYNGERVEQSSTLFFVIATAAGIRATGLPAPIVGWLLGVAGGVLALLATGWIAERCRAGMAIPATAVVAVSGPFVYWAFSGSEPPWVGVTALAVVGTSARALAGGQAWAARAALCLALAAFLLVRPESGIVLLCVAAGAAGLMALRRARFGAEGSGRALRGALELLGITLVATGLLTLFREYYFGSALPQPVTAKSSGLALETVGVGLAYLTSRAWLWPLLASAGVGVVRALAAGLRDAPLEPTRLMLALMGLAYGSFIVLAGGDWMEASRFVAHGLPVFGILALDAWSLAAAPRARRVGAALLVVCGLASTLSIARSESLSLPLHQALQASPLPAPYGWVDAANRAHRRDVAPAEAMHAIVSRLRGAGPERVEICVENAGFVAYYTALRHREGVGFVDLHGLSDRRISETSIGRRIGRSTFGLNWLERDFYEHFDALHAESGVPFPGVAFFNAHRFEKRTAWAEPHGFRVVYWDRSPMPTGSEWLPGLSLPNSQVIAVHRELLPHLEGITLAGNALGSAPRP